MTQIEFFTALANGAKWGVPATISRSGSANGGLPIDAYSIFDSKEKAELYASQDKTAVEAAGMVNNAYIGQIITVWESKDVEVSEGVTEKVDTVEVFYIDADKTLKPVGIVPTGDGATITVTAEGLIALKGFADAANGTVAMKDETGAFVWKTLEEIGAGDGNTITEVTSTDGSVGVTLTTNTEASRVYDLSVTHLEYAVKKLETATEGSQATYQLEKDGEKVGDLIEIPNFPAESPITITKDAEADKPEAATVNVVKGLTANGHELTEESVEVVTAAGLAAAIDAIPEQTDYTVTITAREDVEGDDHSAFKHYVFTQCNNEIGHIDIPRDLVVKSGKVSTVETEGTPYAEAKVGDKYIDLTLTNDEHLYVPAKDLVDVYTAAPNAAKIQIAIDNDNVISASIVDGSIEEDDLAESVQEKLNKTWEEAGTAADLIADLDVDEVTATAAQTFTSIKQEDGKIVVGAPQAISITHDQVSDFENSVKVIKVDSATAADSAAEADHAATADFATTAGTANAAKALTVEAKPVISGEKAITVTVGGQTSEEFTVPFATAADKLGDQTKAEIIAEITAKAIVSGDTGFTTGAQVAAAIGTPGVPAVKDEDGNEITPAKAGTGIYVNVYSKDELEDYIKTINGGATAGQVEATLNQYKIDNDARVQLIEEALEGTTDEESGEVLEVGLIARVDAVEDAINNADSGIKARLTALEDAGHQTDAIETIAVTVNGEAQSVTVADKAATIAITVPTYTLTAATADALGGVKSSSTENTVAVDTDGIMTVNDINVNKLVQTSGDVLILNGGTAAG